MEKKTPLYACHVRANGKLVPFAEYLLPVQYDTGVIAEHMAVRTAAGLFDVSHMGEVLISGRNALKNVQQLVTNDCSRMVDGQVKYSPMCNDSGGVVDDVLVYRKEENCYLIVVNAANRHKDVEWIRGHLTGETTLRDLSDEVAQLALQGPASKGILLKLVKEEELPVKYYSFQEHVKVAKISCLISKTGYTGEDGYELYCSNGDAVTLWEELMKAGKEEGLIPCGLGARDTLRLEAAMPLYGREMDDTVTPFEAGLGFAVKMEKEDFIGKAALLLKGKPARIRVGLKITGRGIAREHCPVYHGDSPVGMTTSGTHSPYLGHPVAMALMDHCCSEIGTRLEVDVRGRRIEAEVVPLPFYKRA